MKDFSHVKVGDVLRSKSSVIRCRTSGKIYTVTEVDSYKQLIYYIGDDGMTRSNGSPSAWEFSATPKVGDWVVITKSGINWTGDMDKYVGKCVKIAEISGTRMVDTEKSLGSYVWNYSQGHYRLANPDEIPKTTSSGLILGKFEIGDLVVSTTKEGGIRSPGDIFTVEITSTKDMLRWGEGYYSNCVSDWQHLTPQENADWENGDIIKNVFEKSNSPGIVATPPSSSPKNHINPIVSVGDWVVILPEDNCYYNAEQGWAQEVRRITEEYISVKFLNGRSNSYKKYRLATYEEVLKSKARFSSKIQFVVGKIYVRVHSPVDTCPSGTMWRALEKTTSDKIYYEQYTWSSSSSEWREATSSESAWYEDCMKRGITGFIRVSDILATKSGIFDVEHFPEKITKSFNNLLKLPITEKDNILSHISFLSDATNPIETQKIELLKFKLIN